MPVRRQLSVIRSGESSLCIQFYFFLTVLGLGCFVQAFSTCREWGPRCVSMHGLLIAVTPLAVEHGFQGFSTRGAQAWELWLVGPTEHRLQQLQHVGSGVVARGLICMQNLPAAAKSLQSCLTLCDPIDGSPPGSPVHGIFQARVLEWIAIAFSRIFLDQGLNLCPLHWQADSFSFFFNWRMITLQYCDDFCHTSA